MNGGSWWAGTRLVAGRAVTEGLASRAWRIITAVLLLLGLAIVIVPQLVGGDTPTYRLGTVGEVSAPLRSQLDAAASLAEFDVEYEQVGDPEEAVREGEVNVAFEPSDDAAQTTLYVDAAIGPVFPATVSQALLAQSTADALTAAGLSADQIQAVTSTAPPEQVPVGRVANEERAGVGFAVGIVLYLALILSGTSIATAVATEKSTRISEVLLAVLRPTQLLVGTVLGVGLLGLVQIATIAVPAVVGLSTNDVLNVPASATGDVALGIAWFIVGILLYAFVFAALATLVEKVTEVGSATMPINVLLIGSYLVAVTVTAIDPNSWGSILASLFPFSAPLVMPVRWASGLVPEWQLLLSMAMTLGTAVLLALVASRIYARGLVRTGRRIALREVLRG